MKLPDDQVLKKAREDLEVIIPGFSGWVEEAEIFRHPFLESLNPPGFYRKVLDFKAGASRLVGLSPV